MSSVAVAAFRSCGHFVDTHAEAVRDHVHRLCKEGHTESQNRWLGEEFVLVLAEPHPIDVVQRSVGEDVDDFVHLDLVDLADHTGKSERQDVTGVPRMDAAAVERSAAVLAGRADLIPGFAEVLRRVEESACGHDVLTRPQEPAHCIHIHDHRRVEHAVGVHRDDRFDVVGRDDAYRCSAGDLTGVLADLFGTVHQDTHEIEHGVLREVSHPDLSYIARHPLDDSICLVWHRFPILQLVARTPRGSSSGRSLYVAMPGAAATTAGIAVIAGMATMERPSMM